MAEIKMAMGKSPITKTRYKGSLNITSDDIKESKDWNIGDKITVLVEIEVTGLRKADRWDIEDGRISKEAVQVNSEILAITTANASKK